MFPFMFVLSIANDTNFMKQIAIIAAFALSLTSCTFINSYTVRSLDFKDHNYITIVKTSASWSKNELVVIDGHDYEVMFVNSSTIK